MNKPTRRGFLQGLTGIAGSIAALRLTATKLIEPPKITPTLAPIKPVHSVLQDTSSLALQRIGQRIDEIHSATGIRPKTLNLHPYDMSDVVRALSFMPQKSVGSNFHSRHVMENLHIFGVEIIWTHDADPLARVRPNSYLPGNLV